MSVSLPAGAGCLGTREAESGTKTFYQISNRKVSDYSVVRLLYCPETKTMITEEKSSGELSISIYQSRDFDIPPDSPQYEIDLARLEGTLSRRNQLDDDISDLKVKRGELTAQLFDFLCGRRVK